MRPHVLLVLGCLVCGCAETTATEPPPSDHASYESGLRLRAHVWRGGGSEVFIDWSDQALDTNCSYARFEDGSTRCAPNAPEAEVGYSDSDCTEPAAYVDGSEPPPYVRTSSEGCAGELPIVKVSALGDERPQSAGFYQLHNGVCTPLKSSGYRVFATTPASPSLFASARVTTESRGAFDVELVTGEDGSRQIGRVIDNSRRAACSTVLSSDDTIGARCLPTNAGALSKVTYVDGGCSKVGVWGVFDENTCAAPTVAMPFSSSPDHPLPLFEVGPRAQAHRMEAGSCVGEPSLSAEPFFELGQALDPSTFPATTVLKIAGGRLSAPIVTAPGDLRPLAAYDASGTFWDADLESYCVPTSFHDNVVRCVDVRSPDFADGAGYADAHCTQMVVYGHGQLPGPHYAISDSHHGHVFTGAARPILGAFDGRRLYEMDSDGVCAASADTDLKDMWLIGDEVALDDAFERVSESLE